MDRLGSIWDIAASRIIEIVGVLLTRASQEGSAGEMALTHLPHNYPLGIWNPSENSIRSWNTVVVALCLEGRKYEQGFENE